MDTTEILKIIAGNEEIQRMFQRSGLIHGDEIPVAGMTIKNIDKKLFSRFYEKQYEESFDDHDNNLFKATILF